MSKQISTNFIGTILLKNYVDAPEELTAESDDSYAVGFAFPQLPGEESIQVGIRRASPGGSHPQGFPQRRASLVWKYGAVYPQILRREDSRVNAGISHQAFQSRKAANISNLGGDGSCRNSSNPLDRSEMLGNLREKPLNGGFDSLRLDFQELHCSGIPRIRQAQRSSSRLLKTLGPLHAQPTVGTLVDNLDNLFQVQGSEFFGSGRSVEELSGGGDEYTGKKALVLREDLIQHTQDSSLSITYLVNELHAEARQVPQGLDVRTGDVTRPNSANTQQVGDIPGILSVTFDLADSGTAVGMTLESIDCHHGEGFLQEVLIECQPVVARGFQSDDAGLRLMREKLRQASHALPGMLQPKEAADLMAVSVQQADFVGTLADIDAHRNHALPPKADLCGRAVPDSMRAYSLVRDAWPNHNQLICSPSQERGRILSCEALPSRRPSAAPASNDTDLPPGRWSFKHKYIIQGGNSWS